MQDIISKLNALKSIEPKENWVVETRKKVLSEAPVFSFSQKRVKGISWKVTEVRNKREDKMANGFFSKKRVEISKISNEGEQALVRFRLKFKNGFSALFSKKLAVSAFTLVFLVSGSALTVEASKSSLPGDSLYIVKIAAENAALAVASEEDKLKIEVEQAGKRLEELAEVSQKPSDLEQDAKVERLIVDFEKKIASANERLTKISDSGKKAKTAKVINDQSEKYTEALVKTTESLPETVKEKVSKQVAKAIVSTEKINMSSLAVMVEQKEQGDDNVIADDEIVAKIKKKINKLEEKILVNSDNKDNEKAEDGEEAENSGKNDSIKEPADIADESGDSAEKDNEDSASEPEVAVEMEKVKKELEKAKISVESDNLSEAIETIKNVNITVDLIDSKSAEGENQGNQGDEGGEVEGVSGEVEELKKENVDLEEEGLE